MGRIMIWSSLPWRCELRKVADRMDRRQSQSRWTEQSWFLAERDIMVSAYTIRKLNESLKLSAAFSSQQVRLHSYAIKDSLIQGPDQLNWHQVDRFYDLNSRRQTTRNPQELCNQIIHSRVFLLDAPVEYPGLKGFFVNSDLSSSKNLFQVDLDVFTRLLRQAAEQPNKLNLSRDKSGD